MLSIANLSFKIAKQRKIPKIVCMKPSVALSTHREKILNTFSQYRTTNPRVFGSTLYHRDHDGSDLDLLVDSLPNTTLFDLGGLQTALEDILGVPVDVVTPGDLPTKFRDKVLAEARPL